MLEGAVGGAGVSAGKVNGIQSLPFQMDGRVRKGSARRHGKGETRQQGIGTQGPELLDRKGRAVQSSSPFMSQGGIAMRPGRTQPLTLTRRALGTRLAGAAAAIGFGNGAAASTMATPVPVLDPDLRGAPVTAAAANAAIERLSQTDPEGALLARLYQMLDVRPAQYWPADVPEAAAADLATLHAAIRACQPVSFGYTDLSGNETTRTVLPLALVHPPQGVKLLALCVQCEDFRQFFVRAMCDLTPRAGNFSEDRLALLEGLLEKETGRA
jgi:hypothetical protein